MLPLSQREAAIRLLRGHAHANGCLPSRAVHQVANQFGISARQMRRYWAKHLETVAVPVGATADGADPVTVLAGADTQNEPTHWWQDPHVLGTIAGTNTLKDAWRTLSSDAGKQVPEYSAFTRTLRKHVDSGVYGAITNRGGREGYLRASLFLSHTQTRRNAVWQADAQEIPVDVTTDTGVQRIKPWQTTFIDDATRVVVATVITATRPTSADVLAALAAGVRGQTLPDGTRIGGIPEAIRWDNGKEFLNEAVNAACARLGIQPQPCNPHSPWQKGKIERWHLTSQAELYDLLPGATHGPRSFSGDDYWRGRLEEVLTLRTLTLRALAWVQEYNCDRVHSELGTTPAAAWGADTTPLQFPDRAVLHQFSLAIPRTRVVNNDGISVKDVKYLAAELGGLVRRRVEVRVLPHDPSVIAVFLDGKYVCEAYPAAALDQTERRRILAHRRETYEEARQHLRAGADRRFRQAREAAEDAAVEAALAGHAAGPAPHDGDDAVSADDDALLGLANDNDTTAPDDSGQENQQ